MISLIAGIGINNELGKKNDLLWHLPADMKHFRETTRGHTVIMGLKTFESLGKTDSGELGRPLPNRKNIVVTRNEDFKREDVEISRSLEETLKKFSGAGEEVFVIGGGEIYKQSIAYADKLYITHVNAEFPDAEVFFPFIDPDIWQKTKSNIYPKDEQNIYSMEFAEYIKR